MKYFGVSKPEPTKNGKKVWCWDEAHVSKTSVLKFVPRTKGE